jgi:AraC-like DNA-binding protein
MPSVDHVCRIFGSPWAGVFGTDIESARHYDRHWHATYGFGLMERGGHRSLSGRGIVDATVGEIITTNPGEVHDGRPLGGTSRRWRMVYLDPDVVESIANESGAASADVRITRPVIQSAALASALRQILQWLEHWSSARKPGADAALRGEEALVRACGRLLSAHSTARPSPDLDSDVAEVRERLADDLVHPPSLAELAQAIGLSRYQLLRRFERAYGLTPYEWQRQVRAERARALVSRGGDLAQIALECGFADQSHMTRAFSAHFGFTPGACAASLGPPRARRA